MSYLNLIQNEYLKIAKKEDKKKTWNQFFSTMGQVEVSNPDPRAKKPKIKITSLRGSTPDTPKGKLLQQLFTKWQGSGVDAVKSHVKSTLSQKETQSLRQQLREKEKQLKLQFGETTKAQTEAKKLKEKLEKRKEQIVQKKKMNSRKKKAAVLFLNGKKIDLL